MILRLNLHEVDFCARDRNDGPEEHSSKSAKDVPDVEVFKLGEEVGVASPILLPEGLAAPIQGSLAPDGLSQGADEVEDDVCKVGTQGGEVSRLLQLIALPLGGHSSTEEPVGDRCYESS